MNQLFKLVIALLMGLLPMVSVAQGDKSYYIQFDDNEVPSIVSENNGILKLKSNDKKLHDELAKHQINKFEKAFPDAMTPSLQKVYILSSDSNLFIKLKKDNPSRVVEEIPEVVLFSENYVPYLVPPLVTPLPNDYVLLGTLKQYNLDLINVSEAWQYTTGNPNFRIGITDTQFDEGNIELTGKLYKTGTDGAGYHGIGVSSVMAGNTNNGAGLASVG